MNPLKANSEAKTILFMNQYHHNHGYIIFCLHTVEESLNEPLLNV